MSYDISLHCKVEGLDKYVTVACPEYDNPTYNIATMLRACMNWDYSQCEKDEEGEYHKCYYRCDFVMDKAHNGLKELRCNPDRYKKYEPENGWGTISTAKKTLSSLIECIEQTVDNLDIPIEYLYMSW